MNFEKKYAFVEEQLSREADSLAGILEKLRHRIPAVLISTHAWQNLLETAQGIPSTVAAFPFGFELLLHTHQAKADLGISLIEGTESAAFFLQQGQLAEASPAAAGLSWLLNDTRSEESAIRKIAGRKLMLEFDSGSRTQEPGIFLRPSEQKLASGGQQTREVALMLDAIVFAAGQTPNSSERQSGIRIYQKLEKGTRIESFGFFPSRERSIRLAVVGFRSSHEVLRFFNRINESPKQIETIDSTVSHFDQQPFVVHSIVNLDVIENGVGPTFGLSFSIRTREPDDPGYWIDDPGQWVKLLDCIRGFDLVIDKKLSALSEWLSKPELLIGRSGALIFIRGIHHVKFVLRENRIDEVKIYLFCLLCPWSQVAMSAGGEQDATGFC